MEEWKKVMWSDESNFYLFQDTRHTVRRPSDADSCDPKYCRPTVKHPPHVMVWGCKSYQGRGDLHILDPNIKMNVQWYCQVLQDHLLVFKELHDTNIFMQDGAPCHMARSVQDWIQGQGITLLD